MRVRAWCALLALSLSLLLLLLRGASAGTAFAWHAERDLERESPYSVASLSRPSPANIGRYATRRLIDVEQPANERDLFECKTPSRELFDNFVRTYNRSFEAQNAATDELERLHLFAVSLKRAIMFNRVVQNAVLNASNYPADESERAPNSELGNYHFVEPVREVAPVTRASAASADLLLLRNSDQLVKLWYADITDCELGLIKYVLFDIFYLLDKNELALAYKVALENSEHLPLLSADGMQQLADILLVRLFDRFQGDAKMNQLFKWPLYMKKLAGYAYNRKQVSAPDYNARMSLVAFAYPHYFKDLKYNALAVNRTDDNVRAHNDHERFNKLLARQFASLGERNRRLAIFRHHWSLVNALNDEHRWQNLTTARDWTQARRDYTNKLAEDSVDYVRAASHGGRAAAQNSAAAAAKLVLFDATRADTALPGQPLRYKHTQFSDLTDAEFVAYLTNDYSLLANSKASIEFIETNFPVRPLDSSFRAELATELELRRLTAPVAGQLSSSSNQRPEANYQLARKVIDELIGEVGLPVGSVQVDNVGDAEIQPMFAKTIEFFGKTYAGATRPGAQYKPEQTALVDERTRRYEQFKQNYARFKAWFIKENWQQMDESQMVAMMRLADMSWHEIKLTLFKVCCLLDTQQQSGNIYDADAVDRMLAANATLDYMASHEFLCKPMAPKFTLQQPSDEDNARELNALELYYYYSVHFNKHHADADTFNKQFNVFRHNIDHIRKHSCARKLTLFRSLKTRRGDTLNTIDVLDARRSHTDDLNLDRYKYFSVPNLNAPKFAAETADGYAVLAEADEAAGQAPYERLRASSSSSSDSTRAGISYNRNSPFESLRAAPSRSGRLVDLSNGAPAAVAKRDLDERQQVTAKYRQNSIRNIYQLVMQRYRFCMRVVRQIELPPVDQLRQQCVRAAGPLADQVGASDALLSSPDALDAQQRQRLERQDQCAFYRHGLEPWSEGLIPQDSLSPQLIEKAHC